MGAGAKVLVVDDTPASVRLLVVHEINDAIKLLARYAKQVAEGAGAASLAAAIKLRNDLRGKKVVGIVSGGNLPLERFAALVSGEPVAQLV